MLSTVPGLTIDFQLFLKELSPDQILFDSPKLRIATGNRYNLMLTLNGVNTWESDYGTFEGTLRTNTRQHVAVTVDGGPKLVTWMVDGVLNDGGATRQFGWGRFDRGVTALNAEGAAGVSHVENLHIYTRPLRTSEAVGNARAAASSG